ncbi:hypothetical protein BDQ12DRAFT_163337 [Crucibulum laeve]|uniref:F-box domain-containing protein n=1 Tax=Crucibulum laeve TaxID=68775 RepID=A0A5C3MPD5_9AGAR|nr:hypothetical protein BDQ12DRAFT_163337 [Crucibulum laeve]
MSSSTANIPRLPQDICDSIIDLLYNDRWSLSACSLVCSDWTPKAQYHFFYEIRLRLVHEFHAFHKLLTISAKHLANLPKNLIICFDELFPYWRTADRATVYYSTAADRVLPKILLLLPNLRSLSLTITFDYAWWSWEYTTPPLKRAIAQVLQLPTLSHFDMRHWLIGPRCFAALIAHSQALGHLGLYRVYMVDSDNLPDPSDEVKIRCPHDLSLYWRPSDDHISWDISVFNIRNKFWNYSHPISPPTNFTSISVILICCIHSWLIYDIVLYSGTHRSQWEDGIFSSGFVALYRA